MKKEQISVSEYNLHEINSIKKKYPELRQLSKAPTFALTYQGTWRTLVTNLGMSEEQARAIEKKYHELYKESDEYVHQRIQQAIKDGYVICAFGLKLRTPLLKTALNSGSSAPQEAKAEARTAGNALGQSWCLLNCRASVEVMNTIWNSKYSTSILPAAQIHDALYFFVKDDLEVIEWFNKLLIKAMSWQEAEEIAHDEVKLGAELEIFYPDWAHGIEIPNEANKQQIIESIQKCAKDK